MQLTPPARRSLLSLVFLLVLSLCQCAFGQATPRRPAGEQLLKGFVQRIAGDTLEYDCFNPLARTAMLTRCTSGTMAIEWKTEAVPTAIKGGFARFVWVASYSTSTSSGDRSFDLFINGTKSLTFRTYKNRNDKQWSVKGSDGSELSFELVQEDYVHDANGYMYLTVPLANIEKGKPLQLKVVGEAAGASDWYMTFMYDMRDRNVEMLPLPFLTESGGKLSQLVFVGINYLGNAGHATVSIEGGKPRSMNLAFGFNDFEIPVPAVSARTEVRVRVRINNSAPESHTVFIKPVAKRSIYLLPHSHNDIGYTAIQTDVLKKQVQNLYDALDLIRKTSSYPPEARFKWNEEVLWSVETFLATAPENKRQEFLDDVKNGSIGLQGLYLNMLTGLMRPEEFYRLTGFARTLREKYGLHVTSAMISDVPGMTWNMVPTLAQSGIKYFSSGPNGNYMRGDRTGGINRSWADRPFYWTSPSGKEKILYWTAGDGYGSLFQRSTTGSASHYRLLSSLCTYFDHLDAIGYPYDMIQMRHTINGDNGTVDPGLPGFVDAWHKKYVTPKLVVATAEQMFEEFERRFGPSIPTHTGDLTPYWEDGAASSAEELGIARLASEQLAQAEALSVLATPGQYDGRKFYDAWKNVLLFDEHTWGAFNSTSSPDLPFVHDQWAIKRQYALDARKQAAALLQSCAPASSAASVTGRFDVINTNSWARTDLVVIPAGQSTGRDLVRDAAGNEVPSQRLSNGDLAFLAQNVPPLAAQRYSLEEGKPAFRSSLFIGADRIADDSLEVVVDASTGAISHLRTMQPAIDYVDTAAAGGMNAYYYVAGLDAKQAQTNGKARITVKESGPLVASLLVESNAPGCSRLTREIRMVHGLKRVEIINNIDKKPVRSNEAVHFGFPVNAPGGQVRIDLGYGVFRPETDQLAGSCKDYYSTQRWADVSNRDHGVTLTVNESPLVEVGEMHSELPAPQNVDWKTTQPPSATLYSYVMNNYWYTNYKADQEGVSTYHYALYPHGAFDQAGSTRMGIGMSQPLVLQEAATAAPATAPFTVSPAGVIVSTLKPAEDGRGYIIRLFNASGVAAEAHVELRDKSQSVFLSSPFEEKGENAGTIDIPADGIVTLRVQ